MKILFYSDVVPMGGHELMSIRLANLLAESTADEIAFLCPQLFFDKLNEDIYKIENTIKPKPLNGSLGLLFFGDYIKLMRDMRSFQPDLIIACQGTVELGIKAVVVARLLGVQVISYIPLVIDLVSTGSKFFPRIRNYLNSLLYKLPNGFITISAYHKKALQRLTSMDVSILHNWVEHQSTECYPVMTKRQDIDDWIKEQRGFDQKIILIIGRIEFQHKQQNKFLEFVCNGELSKNISLVFAGSGSDTHRLIDIIATHQLKNVYYAGNVENVGQLYALVDGVCICSSFEGVPLVLLESVNCSLPVFSFEFDAIKDYLPSDLLAENQNFKQLISIINNHDFSNKKIKYSVSYKSPVVDDVNSILDLINKVAGR